MESPPISPPVDDIIHEEARSLLEILKTEDVVCGVIDMEKIDGVSVSNRIYGSRPKRGFVSVKS